MNICLVNCQLEAELRRLGHNVFSFWSSASGIRSAADIARQARFVPDVLIHQELLGTKLVLSDLHVLECKKVFWSMDTHLNYFWQRHYAQLFDVFCTPHANYLALTASHWTHPSTVRLPIAACERPFVPHAARKHFASMVARVTGERPLRQRLATLLHQHFSTQVVDNLPYADMFDLYNDSRVVPNESICLETNFRLLEGAACGSCLVSPPIGADQSAMFEEGKEILVYHDELELLEILQHCKNHPEYTETIGKAAWERVRQEHLPLHRAQSLLESLPNKNWAVRDTERATYCFSATVQTMVFAGHLSASHAHAAPCPPKTHLQDFLTLCGLIRDKQSDKALSYIHELHKKLQRSAYSTEKEDTVSLIILCGGFALYAGDHTLSQDFLQLYAETEGHKTLEETSPKEAPLKDDLSEPEGVYARWIALMEKDGRNLLYGMHFSGYAQTVLDFIFMHSEKYPLNTLWAKAILASAPITKTNPYLTQTAAARLCMNEPCIEHEMQYILRSLQALDLEEAERALEAALDALPSPQSARRIQSILALSNPRTRTMRAGKHLL